MRLQGSQNIHHNPSFEISLKAHCHLRILKFMQTTIATLWNSNDASHRRIIFSTITLAAAKSRRICTEHVEYRVLSYSCSHGSHNLCTHVYAYVSCVYMYVRILRPLLWSSAHQSSCVSMCTQMAGVYVCTYVCMFTESSPIVFSTGSCSLCIHMYTYSRCIYI
jgi:hypothetical protein